jgi:hypothetical protein
MGRHSGDIRNCAALNKVHPHGDAKKGARDKVTGKTKPVTAFTVQTPTTHYETWLAGRTVVAPAHAFSMSVVWALVRVRSPADMRQGDC